MVGSRAGRRSSAPAKRLLAELHGVSTEFSQFRVLLGNDWVVIDSVATYAAVDAPTTTVASCDIYRFRDGRVTELTSYNIELGD